MTWISIDIETFSSVDIKTGGLYKYVQSPDFEILLFAYSVDGGATQIVDLKRGETIPSHIINALTDSSVEKRAYNAAFEWYCLSKYFRTYLPIDQWRCTMVHGLYLGFPAGLTKINEALNIPQDKKKLRAGTDLIRKFCVPRKPTKTDPRTRVLPHHEPEKWQLFKEYCAQDVVSEMAVKDLLKPYPLPEREYRLWLLDQSINLNGIRLDLELVEGAIYVSELIEMELLEESKKITGVDNPKSIAQLKEWLEAETDESVDNLQKATVADMIENATDGNVRRLLEIRKELGKTSVTKYKAMANTVCADGRVRGLLQFYGANRTGRWAGRLVQVQNLPRNYLDTLDLARERVKLKDAETLKLLYKSIPDTLSQLIRTAFIAPEGSELCVSDFSAIEARVIAWLAGEQWRLDVFATHGKIYEASASAMFHVPIEKIKKGNPEYELRQKGKIAELALGYQGGVGALKTMGALNMGLSEEELPDIVERWRNSNRCIVDLWSKFEQAALYAMQGSCCNVAGCTFSSDSNFFMIDLPSGRTLYYPYPSIKQNKFGKPALHYYGQDLNKWTELSTYGGKLTENIVQAIARDCLAEALIKVSDAGYKPVMHIHDEIVAEGHDLERMNKILSEPIPWAPGLLLRGDGFTSKYYKKE